MTSSRQNKIKRVNKVGLLFTMLHKNKCETFLWTHSCSIITLSLSHSYSVHKGQQVSFIIQKRKRRNESADETQKYRSLTACISLDENKKQHLHVLILALNMKVFDCTVQHVTVYMCIVLLLYLAILKIQKMWMSIYMEHQTPALSVG